MSVRPRTIKINGVRHIVPHISSQTYPSDLTETPQIQTEKVEASKQTLDLEGDRISRTEKSQAKKEEKLRHSIFDEFDKIAKKLRETTHVK